MDVLRPTLININGRLYRKNAVKEQTYQNDEEEEFSYSENSLCTDEPCDSLQIEQTDKGYRCAIDVPSVLYKYIIGKKGETKKRLETETRTSINIPKQGVEGEIVITGQQRSSVISACTRIELLVESFRKKQPFTHFLSFALNEPHIQKQFLKFKEEVLSKCSQDNGIDGSIFQNPAKLHLTIGTLALLNEKEVRKACDLLQVCKDEFIKDITGVKPLPITVGGIEYMNDDPAMVDVLYAQVQAQDGSAKHQIIADQLLERFVASGLMTKEWDRVKLHATVMNTIFRKDPTAEDKGPTGLVRQERESFDARNVLKMFERYHFGDLDLNAVHLSQRYSTDISGYYTSSGFITFS
ncbi:activating signal cointegrator 1 complex subunit 1 [Polypterus senegalus]|uniref:activating signal cointegrator 1 complex subunit 1 n=1 Tax=Polypterus senegalus TaxID=55291 RepID=UPI0019648830|nr:activating signal cointegrator 1 complex subunit 1 [Polypterus senegalus]